MTALLPPLASSGHALDLSGAAFGELRRSDSYINQPEVLRERIDRDGYLYLPGFFERDDILAVRETFTRGLAEQGLLDPAYPHLEAVLNPHLRASFKPEWPPNNRVLLNLVFGRRLLGFYEAFFGEPVKHFDFTWLRAIAPGPGTKPHCDWVYMGRGTHDLLTCWIPYGDVPLDLGGLMVLEDSHQKSGRIRAYLEVDVDTYCENRPDHVEKARQGKWTHTGSLSNNPVSLQQKLGGRWLTTEWSAGDLITFKMNLIHASLDNASDRIRLSSDTRYQRASEPADERWIGPNPAGHSTAGKRGRIC